MTFVSSLSGRLAESRPHTSSGRSKGHRSLQHFRLVAVEPCVMNLLDSRVPTEDFGGVEQFQQSSSSLGFVGGDSSVRVPHAQQLPKSSQTSETLTGIKI